MQPSARQQELERLYNSRRGHTPQLSISDSNHHVTEAIGSYYDDDDPTVPADARPLSFVSSPSEAYEEQQRRNKRNGSYFGMARTSPPRTPLAPTRSNEKVPSPTAEAGNASPNGSVRRVGSRGSEHGVSATSPNGPASPPPLARQSSNDTAIQQFPLNDIDYESSPAAVAQELSNLQAIRRMSMNVDTADPDLPSFGAGGLVPTVAPTGEEDENDTSRLFWVPARLHPELAPKEFKTFVEDRVDKIRRRSGESDSLSVDGLERSASGSSLRRKKSMLSHQIDTKGNYEDGAERLERQRSNGKAVERQATVDLAELETLVNDPAQFVQRMSLDTARNSYDSGVDVPPSEDMPILPPVGQSLKRSTRTTYRRGSLKKGERVPFSKRAQQRQNESESDEPGGQSAAGPSADEPPSLELARVQTEPILPPSTSGDLREEFPSRSSSRRNDPMRPSVSNEELAQSGPVQEERSERLSPPPSRDEDQPPPRPQQRQFQSRLVSGPGRTTAQLPGYNNTNPLPNIIETLPDGTKVPVSTIAQSIPERKSSFDLPRPFQRGGAHTRPVPGRDFQRSSTLEDISSHPSPFLGSSNTSTDALTMVPTFDDRKLEKKDSTKKSSWKWILGSDDEEKKAAKEERNWDSTNTKSSRSKLGKQSARLDVLQSSIEGNVPSRGRESLVLSREDIKLEEERRKESKKSSESKKDRDKDTGLLSAIFGGKKKSSDNDLKEKKRGGKPDRNLSPDPIPRILKPDIDYNWTRFSILEERAIYRMAHIKLANPRRALYSQVLLSNFMYSYLAKVQMMHPQVQIPAAHQKNGQHRKQQQQQQQQQQEEQQPAEYGQYQRWQQQQEREEAQTHPGQQRSSFDAATGGGQVQQHQQYQQRASAEYEDDPPAGYDPRSSEEYDDVDPHHNPYGNPYAPSHGGNGNAVPPGSSYQPNGVAGHHRSGGGGGGSGYSVAGSHDYLGYPKGEPSFEQQALWEDEEKSEELW